jgi:glycosyltransferase involved in cell wall biosynthesis
MTVSAVAGDVAARAVARRRAFVRHQAEGPVPGLDWIRGRDADLPQVTIIIPTVDGVRGGNLARLLDQITRQTFQRFEIIIVEGDRRQGRAINTAAAIARGDLLVTMDDDTQLGPDDLLEKIVRAFEEDETIGIAGVSNIVPPDAPWIVQRAMRELPRRSSRLVSRVIDSDMAEHPCLAIRRELFYRVGGEHEQIPRGLDPYLRGEIRALGYRVVVLPHTWIHHLLPATLRGILRQYFRNGVGAAYVKKFYPALVIDQATDHRQDVPRPGTFLARAMRYVGHLASAFLSLRLVYLATLIAYAVGYAWGVRVLMKESL